MYYVLIGISVVVLVILFIYGLVNYNLKSFVGQYIRQENFENQEEENEDKSIRPIDECKKMDEKEESILRTAVSGGIPQAPFKYNDYVGDIYFNNKTNPIGKENGKYCIKKPKLLFDGIWSPYQFYNDGWEKTEWELTNGNLSEGEVCMKSLYNTLKPMPKWSPPDCPVKCQNDCEIGVYCNGPPDNDPQDLTDANDSTFICFPSVFTPGIKGEKPLKTYGF